MKKDEPDELVGFADMLAAMGTETRLRIMRLLLAAHPAGLVVGEIQEELAINGSTLSHHLQHLRGAGLMSQVREGSALRCQVDIDLVRAVAGFLVTECCAGVRLSDDADAA